MTDDRTLLELAAKAAGIELWHEDVFTNGLTRRISSNGVLRWNPLTDDGDALRLAVKLGFVIDVRYSEIRGMGGYNRVNFWPPGQEGSAAQFVACHDCDGDPGAAIRRAIVRAAAALAPKE